MPGIRQFFPSSSARLRTSNQSIRTCVEKVFSPIKRLFKNTEYRSDVSALSTIATNNALTQLPEQTNHTQRAVLPPEIWLYTLKEHCSFEKLIRFSTVSSELRANVFNILRKRFRLSSDKELEQLYTLLLSKEAQTAYQNNPDFERLLENGPAQWTQNCNWVEIFKLLLFRNKNQINENQPLTREELMPLKLRTLTVPANTASTPTETAASSSTPFSDAHSAYFFENLPLFLTQKQEPDFEVFFTKVLPEWVNETPPGAVIVTQTYKNPGNTDIQYLYACKMFVDDRIYLNGFCNPMIIAANNNHFPFLEGLIKADFNINAIEPANGNSALHYAVSQPDIKTIQLLIENNADINKRNHLGMTPLHAAAESGSNLENIKCLIRSGADINLLDNKGFSALHYAAKHNRKDIVEFLIAHPNLNPIFSEKDHEVWDYVREKGYRKIIKILEKDRNPISAWAKETLTQLSQIKIAASTSRPL